MTNKLIIAQIRILETGKVNLKQISVSQNEFEFRVEIKMFKHNKIKPKC